MKKVVLVAIILMSVTITSGQTTIGIKAGINLSTTEGLVKDNKYKIAEHFGAFANIPLNNRFYIHPELVYSVKGCQFPLPGRKDKGSLSFSYITLPVMFGTHLNNSFSILLGPEAGYLINAKYRFADSSSSHPEWYNKVDFGINFGADFKINNQYSIEFRYNHSLKGIVQVMYTDQLANQTENESLGLHRNFQFSLNYRFLNK